MKDVLFPSEIVEKLKEHTIGQDAALLRIANATHNHLVALARLKHKVQDSAENLSGLRKNLLLMGPSGCGKTSSIRHLGKILNAHVEIGNAAHWAPTGYKGNHWNEMFVSLLGNTKSQAEAEQAIMFIDEIDKRCTGKSKGDEGTFYQNVLKELLGVIEGGKVTLESGKTINTGNIFFIFAGAFDGMRHTDSDDPVTTEELLNFGMPREFVGRIGCIAQFKPFDEKGLINIMKSAKDSPYKTQIARFKTDYNIDLKVSDEALREIAKVGIQHKTGARSLNTLLGYLIEENMAKIQENIGKSLVIGPQEIKVFLEKISKKKKDELPEWLQHLYL